MSDIRITQAGRRLLTCAAIVLGLVAMLALAASAAQVVAGPALKADDARVPAGETLVLHGRGFPHDAHITLRAGRVGEATDRIGSAHTGRRGGFVADVQIDADAAPGRYVAIACHDRCTVKATAHFRVKRS